MEKIKILAIDDNFDNLIIIQALVSDVFPTADVLLATSGKEGLILAEKEDPDVILVDVVMPGMDGFEVCEKLKSNQLTCDIPVIFITALKGDKESRIHGLEVGAEAFLAKPIDETELVAQIRAMAKIKKANIEKKNQNIQLAYLVANRTLELNETHYATLNLLEDLKTENEERRKAEKNLQRVARLYAIHSQINQSIIKSNNKDELFKSICRVTVEFGKFRMAWVGLVDETDKKLRPFTFAGWNEGYVEHLLVTADATINSNGPTGRAILTGKLTFCNDIENDPVMLPWRDEALKRGYQSSIAVPLKCREKAIGALTLYASEKEFITDDEKKLLKEISEDISFGLDAIEAEKERDAAKEEVLASEEKYRLLVENSPNGIAIYQDGKFVFVNKAALSIMSAKNCEDIVGKPVLSIVHKDSVEAVINRMKLVYSGNFAPAMEEKLIRIDGSAFYAEVVALATTFNGKPAGQVLVTDITERKKAEEILRKSEEEQRLFSERLTRVLESINELSRVDSFDELCRKSVEIAIERLGFNRVGLCFLSEDKQTVLGAYGTDENGQLINEQHLQRPIKETPTIIRLLEFKESVIFFEDEILFNDKIERVGIGNHAVARLWDGENTSGFYTTDNLTNSKPITKNDVDILEIYSNAMGHLFSLKRAEIKLALSETKYREMVEQINDVLFSTDMNYRFTFISAAVEAMGGYKPDEIIGQLMTEFVDPAFIPFIGTQFTKIIAGEVEPSEFRVKKKNGEYIWVRTSSKPIIENNRPIGVRGVLTEIDAVKQAEFALRESEEKFKSLFNRMNEMILIQKIIYNDAGEVSDYRILDCNPTFAKIFGIPPENIIGKLASEVYYPYPLPYLEEYAMIAKTGESMEFNSYRESVDKYLQISIVQLSEGVFATIASDITDIKRSNERIMEKNLELENYLYVTSHDLRSPLVNIQGFSSRLKKQTESIRTLLADCGFDDERRTKIEEIISEKVPSSLDFIFNNVTKMDMLINGLLQISRTGRVVMNIKQNNMTSLITNVIRSFDFQTKEIGATMDIEALPDCYGDENMLNQLFSNIIGNAIKYRDTKTPLSIHILGKKQLHKVVYEIHDNGIGIKREHLEKIWNVFYRVDDKHSQGEGIGLSISKRIVDKHKGKIWVESEENKGTTFFIELSSIDFNE